MTSCSNFSAEITISVCGKLYDAAFFRMLLNTRASFSGSASMVKFSSRCRVTVFPKCICERSRNPHVDTAEVKCLKKWISASFRRTFKAAKRKLPLYENSFIKATAPISFLFILYYFIASIVLIHTSISPFPRLFQQQ